MEEFETNAGDKLWVHNAGDCRGPACPIHNPTPHHMRAWKMIWRGDRRIFERLCPRHGTGHPDPDDMAAQKAIKGFVDGVHGCCGCCYSGGLNEMFRAVDESYALREKRERGWTMVDLDPDLR